MDMCKAGRQIALQRKKKGLTQEELGSRLGISCQAVSRWERGETLPDTGILPELSQILETTIDYLLSGGEPKIHFEGRLSVKDALEGLRCLDRMGRLLGRDHMLYRYAVEGINREMHTDIEEAFRDPDLFECFGAEILLDALTAGKYVDPTEVKNSFQNERFRDMVLSGCKKSGIY